MMHHGSAVPRAVSLTAKILDDFLMLLDFAGQKPWLLGPHRPGPMTPTWEPVGKGWISAACREARTDVVAGDTAGSPRKGEQRLGLGLCTWPPWASGSQSSLAHPALRTSAEVSGLS